MISDANNNDSNVSQIRVHLNGLTDEKKNRNWSSLPLKPRTVDVIARKYITDSYVSTINSLPGTYDKKNLSSMLVCRSGRSTVKKIIRSIHMRCEEQRNELRAVSDKTRRAATFILPLEQEILILAQWATDSYYNTIIRTCGGIKAVIQAMKTFSDNAGVQECSCLLLCNLSCVEQCVSETNTVSPETMHAIHELGGVQVIVDAMINFPNSVAVQAAACDCLRNMSGLLHMTVLSLPFVDETNHDSVATALMEDSIDFTSHSNTSQDTMFSESTATCSTVSLDNLVHVLSHARRMDLLRERRSIAEELLSRIQDVFSEPV